MGGPAAEPLRIVGVRQEWPGKDWTVGGPHTFRQGRHQEVRQGWLGYGESPLDCIPRVT